MKLKFTLIFGCLLFVSIMNAQSFIISSGDEWRYYDDSQAPSPNWINENSNESKWSVGKTPIGYGEDNIKTVIRYGTDDNNKDITKYFYKTFEIENPNDFFVYELKYQKDDGIVIYLNGEELMRNNIRGDVVTHKTEALTLMQTSRLEDEIFSHTLMPIELLKGSNTISASVHQSNPTSSDCFFNLELIGHNDPQMISLVLHKMSLDETNLKLKVSEIDHKMELERREAEIKNLTNTVFFQRNMVYMLAFFVLTALAVFLYLRKISNDTLKKEKELTAEVKEALLIKDKKLLSSSLEIVQNQQFLNEIKGHLTNDNKDYSELKKIVKNVLGKIDFNLKDGEWLNLLNRFNSVHSGFIERLTSKHPSLSESQIRHCVFMKLRMETKEIAQLMHVNPRSVQVARYRIKKNMSLDEAVDLIDYIHKI